MRTNRTGLKITSIEGLSEVLGGRANLDALLRKHIGLSLDEVEKPRKASDYGQKPFRYRGRTPIRTTLVEAQIDYYNGEPQDRVRLQVLTDGSWQISGWPHAPVGEKRPRERSFELDDGEASLYEFKLGQLEGLVPGKGHRANEEYGELREAAKIVLRGTPCDGRYSWENGAPGKWRKLEELVMGLVFRFHELCRDAAKCK